MGTNERKRRDKKREIFVLIVILIGLASVAYGVHWFFESRKLVRAHFQRADGTRTSTFYLEAARTDQEQEKGLMYRKELEPEKGMVFIYPEESPQTFWMKNTYIPLDMIFAKANGEVVALLKNVPILNEIPRRSEKPAQYVIELNAGTADKERIEVGSTVRFESGL